MPVVKVDIKERTASLMDEVRVVLRDLTKAEAEGSWKSALEATRQLANVVKDLCEIVGDMQEAGADEWSRPPS